MSMTSKINGYRNLRDFSISVKSHSVRFFLWFGLSRWLFEFNFQPTFSKFFLLRLFGAKLGKRVVMRRGVKVHFPWNLEIGDDGWIGEDVWFINHEKITVGSNVCISQRSIICSGGHDYMSASLAYQHKPIEIRDGAWICLDAKVLPGVTIGECSVIAAGEIVRKSVPDFSIMVDGQIRKIEPPR